MRLPPPPSAPSLTAVCRGWASYSPQPNAPHLLGVPRQPPVAVEAALAPLLGCLFCSAASTRSRGGRIRAEMQGEETGFLPARRPAGRKPGHPATASGDGRAPWQGGVLGWFIYAGLFRRSPRFPPEKAAASPAPGVPRGPAPGAAGRAHAGGRRRGNGAGNRARAGAAELEQAEINSVCQEMAQTQPSGCFSRCSLSMHGSPCPGPALAAAPSMARRALGAAAPDGMEPWKPGRALQVFYYTDPAWFL